MRTNTNGQTGKLIADRRGEEIMEMMKALSPWAEVDYEDAKGLTPRVDTLDGKRIGLFAVVSRMLV